MIRICEKITLEPSRFYSRNDFISSRDLPKAKANNGMSMAASGTSRLQQYTIASLSNRRFHTENLLFASMYKERQ